jgi:hypothetical protein
MENLILPEKKILKAEITESEKYYWANDEKANTLERTCGQKHIVEFIWRNLFSAVGSTRLKGNRSRKQQWASLRFSADE